MARPHKRRAFGSLMVVRRGEHKYLQAGYEPPLEAFSKWKGVHISKRITKSFALNERTRAEAWLYKIQRSIEMGTWVPPQVFEQKQEVEGITFSAYAEQWMAHHRRPDGSPLSAGTLEKYREYLHDHILPVLGSKHLRDITEADISEWWDDYPITPDGKGVSNRAHCYALLKGIMISAAKETGSDGETLIARNPCTIKENKPRAHHEQVIATEDELYTAAEAMPAPLKLTVLLAGVLGLRRGEVLGLERRDIDLDQMVINVRRSAKQERTDDGWHMTLGSTKTPTGRRQVMIPTRFKAVMEEQLERTGKEDDALLFPGKSGGVMHFSWLEDSWMRARMTVPRLAHMHYHDLRHTALTHLAQHGATVAELEQIAGHSDARTAMHYQHAVDEHERQVVNNTAADSPREQKPSDDEAKTASAPDPTGAQQQETDPKKLADLISSWDVMSRTKFLTTLSPELRNQVVVALAAGK